MLTEFSTQNHLSSAFYNVLASGNNLMTVLYNQVIISLNQKKHARSRFNFFLIGHQ